MTAPFSFVLPMQNKWDTPGTVTSQVRSLRKTNNDHVAIAVDVNPDGRELEDEDDDKGNATFLSHI